jgi:hypothetical protein
MELKEKVIIADNRKDRVETRALNPRTLILEVIKKKNFDNDINDFKNNIYPEIIKEPYNHYFLFRTRLKETGMTASFPEFKGTVSYLAKKIFQDEEIYNFLNINHNVLLNQLLHKFVSLQIEGKYYYPYRATIYCIENMLEILDIFYRSTMEFAPYYHSFLYRTYLNVLTDDINYCTDNIVFPCCKSIGATDVIKTRSVPILFLGVSDIPLLADQYLNTPLEFWSHDIQHVRRQIQETNRYYDEYEKNINYYTRRDIFTIQTQLEFYKKMETYVKEKILPIISIVKIESEKVKAFKQIKKLIIFEICHEITWPITPLSLCRNILLRYDSLPTENINVNTNPESKFLFKTVYTLFDNATTLANVLGKLRSGFFDDVNNTYAIIVNEKYRTSQYISEAAMELLIELKCEKIPSSEYILALTTDPTTTGEYKDMKQISTPDKDLEHLIPYPHEEINLFDDGRLQNKYKIIQPYGVIKSPSEFINKYEGGKYRKIQEKETIKRQEKTRKDNKKTRKDNKKTIKDNKRQ